MKRLSSIDITRGLVMVIMALDHVRDFMHITSMSQDPTNLHTTTFALFMTRWITHLCAPTFVFLSGTSAYISFKKTKDIAKSRNFLLTRGIWLILLEFSVVNFALWFDIHFQTLIMEVICAIGAGFIVLSLLLKLSSRTVGIIGIVVLFGHDLFPGLSFKQNPVLDFFTSVLFRQNLFMLTPHFAFITGYPLVPWLGILLVGFGCGPLFELPVKNRKKTLLKFGFASVILFVLIRLINFYGDPAPWSAQTSPLFTFLSFINLSKYPPSLLFSLLMLGIMFLLLAIANNVKNKFTDVLSVFGKVPLFYFIIHLYLIHLLMLVMVFAQGFGFGDLHFGLLSNGRPVKGCGIKLWLVYLIWITVVIALYPLCKWYGRYKIKHAENKLLRYL